SCDRRSVFGWCSRSTQEVAYELFGLPHPFGPVMAATPAPLIFSSVRSQKDLIPRICSFFSLSNFNSLSYGRRFPDLAGASKSLFDSEIALALTGNQLGSQPQLFR